MVCHPVSGLVELLIRASVAYWVYNLTLHPLAAIPGPKLAAASSLWSRRKEWQLRKAHAMLDAHKKYGPVVRTQPNELSFADPGVLATIYPPAGKGFVKSDFYVRRKMYQLDQCARSPPYRQRSSRAACSRFATLVSTLRAASLPPRPFLPSRCSNLSPS
jgi:hypothetical protein